MEIANTLAARAYEATRSATQPTSGGDGGSFLGQAATDFAQTLRQSEEVAMASMTGDADPHALVQALTQTEIALETAVAVRDKVVEAYQEILRMPV